MGNVLSSKIRNCKMMYIERSPYTTPIYPLLPSLGIEYPKDNYYY